MAKDLNKFGNKKITTLFSQINNLQDTLKSDNTTGLDSVSNQTLLIFNKESNTDKAELYIADENLENIIEVGNNICKINYRISTLNLPDKINDETVNYKVGEKVLFTHSRNNVRIYTLTENDIENKKLLSSYVKAKENNIYFVLFDNSLLCYNDGWIKAISVLTAGEGINIKYRNNINNIISLLPTTDETLGGIKTGFNNNINPQNDSHHLFGVLIDNDEYEKDESGNYKKDASGLNEKNKNYQKAYINIPTASARDTNTELGLESSYGLIKVGFNPDKQIFIKDEPYAYSYEYYYLVDPEVNPLDRNFSVQLNKKGQAFVNISKASDEKFGTVKLGFDPNGQIIEQPVNEEETPERINLMGEDFPSDRVYPLRLNTLGQAFTYVPWIIPEFVNYDDSSKELTKTVDKTTVSIVSASKIVTDGGGLKNIPNANVDQIGGVKVSYRYSSTLDNIHAYYGSTDDADEFKSDYPYHFGLQSDSTGKAFVNIPQLAYLGTKLYSVNYSNGKLTTSIDQNSGSTDIVTAAKIVEDGGGIKSLEHSHSNYITSLAHSHTDYITTASTGLTKDNQIISLNQANVNQIGGVKISYNYNNELYIDAIHDPKTLEPNYPYNFGLMTDITGSAFVNIPQLAYIESKLESVQYKNKEIVTRQDENGPFTTVVSSSQIVEDGGGLLHIKDEVNANNITNGAYSYVSSGRTNWITTYDEQGNSLPGIVFGLGNLQIGIDANGCLYSRNKNNDTWYLTNQLKTIDDTDDTVTVYNCDEILYPAVIGYGRLNNGPLSDNVLCSLFCISSADLDFNGYRSVIQIVINRVRPETSEEFGDIYMRTVYKQFKNGNNIIITNWRQIGGLESRIAALENKIAELEARLNNN